MTDHVSHQGAAGSRLSTALRIVLGLLAIGAVALLARLSLPERPPGSMVIRPPGDLSALAVQGDILWAGGAEGLVMVDRSTSVVSPAPDPAKRFRYVRDLLVDRENALWVAHRTGLSRYANGEWRDLEGPDSLPPGPTLSLWQDRAGGIWVGGENGVVHLSEGSPVRHTTADGLAAPEVDVIFQDRDGVMWFGSASPTQGGLTSYDGRAWRTFSTREGLAHNSINAIIQDRIGALWFGTGFDQRGGANRLSGGVWSTLTRQDGLAGEKVRSIFEDRQGRLWFGSEYDGVAVFDGLNWKILTTDDGLASWEVKKIVQDPDGVYWLATMDGLTRLPAMD